MWVTILFYATFVLELIFKVFTGTGSLEEDLREDLGHWAYMTRQLVWLCQRILVGLFSVVV